MKRVNKAIELLEKDQPVYYITTRDFTYENGMLLSKTWADIIRLDLEHGAFDMTAVGEFMKGILDGGPTASGHLTPCILAELPTDGTNAEVMMANAWMIKQILAQGVHGILLCHAETVGAVQVLNECCRYSFNEKIDGLGKGRRGHGGQEVASKIWGLTESEYLKKSDLWPLNPSGELLIGVKIENMRALENVEITLTVPGLAYAEWGPGDMGMSMCHPERHDPPYPEIMTKARNLVKKICLKNNLYFLDQVNRDDFKSMIDEGVRICKPANEDVAEKGRRYTNNNFTY